METFEYCLIEFGDKSGYLRNLIKVVPKCILGSTFNTFNGNLDLLMLLLLDCQWQYHLYCVLLELFSEELVYITQLCLPLHV